MTQNDKHIVAAAATAVDNEKFNDSLWVLIVLANQFARVGTSFEAVVYKVKKGGWLPVVHEYIGLPEGWGRYADIRHVAILRLVPTKVCIVPLLTKKISCQNQPNCEAFECKQKIKRAHNHAQHLPAGKLNIARVESHFKTTHSKKNGCWWQGENVGWGLQQKKIKK